jgi:tetratricopeptide (TPR) repeat protein
MLADESRHLERQLPLNPPVGASLLRLRSLVSRGTIGLAVLLVVIQGPTARGQAEAVKAPLDPAAVKSRLVVRTVKNEKGARQVVMLGKPEGTPGIPDSSDACRLDMLPRELVRQAVLIAARDELGLSTRDQVIDGAPADSGSGAGDQVEVVSFIRQNRSHEQIRRVGKDKVETLLAHETPMAQGRNLELNKLLESTELLSRKELPGVLKNIGSGGKPNAVMAEGGYPREVEDGLGSLGYVDVLLAVRELHRVIRSAGESSERLGALVRGYSLLGVLSEHEWSPAHRAFKARALLYAQRLVARDSESPWGFWHRAFAWALVGRHGDALADLALAKQKSQGKNAGETPEWVELVDAFAHFDSGSLARKEGPKAKLPALLCMLTLSFPRTITIGLQSAKDVVALQPDCFRAHDAMCDFQGVSTQHMTTMLAPQALEQFLFEKVPGLEGIPANLKEQLANRQAITQAAELFDKAGTPDFDAGEPSWGALGRMVRETRFVQIFRRLYFMKVLWSVPVDEYWNEVREEIAGHRYSGYLESMTLAQDAQTKFRQFADSLDLTDIETTETEMSRSLWSLGRPHDQAAWTVATAHEDETAEMARTLWNAEESTKLAYAREILKVSPFHAYARAILISKDWANVKDQVAAWEKESGVSPAVLAQLGWHYSENKQYADAERVLTRYIGLSPDFWAFRALAGNFKAQGKIDRWQATLDEFLKKVEDPGLDHARVRVEIADYYMGLAQWDKAKPYAEDAAATWAEWAMQCAGRCAEGQKDWQRAESWYRRVTERYAPSSWAVWYFFCKRTGQGDLAAARESVDRYVSQLANRPDLHNEEYSACFYWLDGRLEKANADFARAYQNRTSISAALCLAMIADDQKNVARRNELIKELVTKHKDKAPKTVELCRMFLDTVFAPPGSNRPLDVLAVDRVLQSIEADGRGNAEFFVGWFLKNQGDSARAKKHLQQTMDSELTGNWYRVIARDALKAMEGK